MNYKNKQCMVFDVHKFEKVLEKMSEMSEEQLEHVLDMEKKKLCICRTCSTYTQCIDEGEEGLFCMMGRSNCDVNINQCACSECPIHSNFQLKYDSFCRGGSELDQRNK